jgi:hypothetical protein
LADSVAKVPKGAAANFPPKNEKSDNRRSDVTIAAVAAVLTLFLAGDITKFGVGTNGITVEKAIVNAAHRPVHVTPLPVEPIEGDFKLGTSQIRDFIRRQVQALEYQLGYGGYTADATKEYLDRLTVYPFFRFVVLVEADKAFFGMIEAKTLHRLLRSEGTGQTFESFTTLIKRNSFDDRAQLAQLPGFAPLSAAVTSNDNKRHVLEQMDKRKADWLPVLSPNGELQNVVDRSRLLASMILDVTDQLGAASSGELGPASSRE